MPHKNTLGLFGENQAEKYLKNLGYKIIDKNYYTRFGEIDIVAKKDEKLFFIEVKTRQGTKFGWPEESFDFRKQKKFAYSLYKYLGDKNCKIETFQADLVIVEIIKKSAKIKIKHYQNILETY